ncbi:Hypothetical predicted protein, partial [Olea europaea subsp. europaea]
PSCTARATVPSQVGAARKFFIAPRTVRELYTMLCAQHCPIIMREATVTKGHWSKST